MKEITKKYHKENFTIVWKPGKCIHAAECVGRLPKVYNPDEKPWIKPENASVEELKSQINACPSGALSYLLNKSKNEIEETMETKIDVTKDGPLLVHGTVKITNSNGSTETKEKMTALCRCGHSSNKPYCDGSHKKNGFVG